MKVLKGNEPPLKLTIDTKNYLPEYNADADDKSQSCSGGVRMHARKGRIVCSNTIDERLQLCFEEAIPEIRKLMFPNY